MKSASEIEYLIGISATSSLFIDGFLIKYSLIVLRKSIPTGVVKIPLVILLL